MSHKQRTLISSNKSYSIKQRKFDRIINKFKKILNITKKKEDIERVLLSETKSHHYSNESLTEYTSAEYANYINESYVNDEHETDQTLTLQNIQRITQSDKYRKQLIAETPQQCINKFTEQFPEDQYQNIGRLDSGAYGDIFICYDCVIDKYVVLKVIRAVAEHFQGIIPGESLSDVENFNDIINEVMISTALSKLHEITSNELNELFEAHCFPFLFDKCLVNGDIPEYFFSDQNQSMDNNEKKLTPIRKVALECYPDFPREYAVIKMNYCGEPIWKMIKENRVNAIQLLSVAKQISFGLAVAETVYQFEHRDLHISNVLLKKTDDNEIYIKYIHRSNIYWVESYGYKVKIIDNTFSRIKIGENIYYKDMRYILKPNSTDGDNEDETLQERIYQRMIKETENEWKSWAPKTNVLWLYYIYKTFNMCSIVTDSNDSITKQFFAKLIHIIRKCKRVEEIIPYIE